MSDSGISNFSRSFSAALQGVMRENRIRVEDVAKLLGRSKGYVSQHTNGSAAPSTDLIDAVAQLLTRSDGQAVRTEDLVHEVIRRMDAEFGEQLNELTRRALRAISDGAAPSGGFAIGEVVPQRDLEFVKNVGEASLRRDDLAIAQDAEEPLAAHDSDEPIDTEQEAGDEA